jgi:hypothetical protein
VALSEPQNRSSKKRTIALPLPCVSARRIDEPRNRSRLVRGSTLPTAAWTTLTRSPHHRRLDNAHALSTLPTGGDDGLLKAKKKSGPSPTPIATTWCSRDSCGLRLPAPGAPLAPGTLRRSRA